jgi:cell division protein FtsA
MAREPYLVVVDIGSNSIKLAVAKDTLDDQDKVQILALVERESSGIRRGIITNMTEATDALVEVINQAEAIIGLPIKKTVVGVNGTGISFTNSEGLVVVSRSDGEITEGDIDRVINDSLTKAFGIDNAEILHIIPKFYMIDNQGGIRYPAGMIGSKLEVKTLVVSAEQSYLRNFTKVFDQASVDIMDRIFTPLASADFILSLKQKKAGTILIDIGYASTSYIVWENEEICGSGVIPIGSDHITSDLAVGLQTNMEMAEEIKKQHLHLLAKDDTEGIEEVEVFNPDLQINENFRLDEIRSYARPRVEEIFLYINQELQKMGKAGKLPGGAVIVGGGSALQGIDEIARRVLRLPVFKHVFDRRTIEFVPDYNNDPSFINCIALAAYALHNQEEIAYQTRFQRQSGGHNKPTRENNSDGGIGGFMKKFLPWS